MAEVFSLKMSGQCFAQIETNDKKTNTSKHNTFSWDVESGCFTDIFETKPIFGEKETEFSFKRSLYLKGYFPVYFNESCKISRPVPKI